MIDFTRAIEYVKHNSINRNLDLKGVNGNRAVNPFVYLRRKKWKNFTNTFLQRI